MISLFVKRAKRNRPARVAPVRRGWRKGVAGVEFALISLPFMTLVVGIAEITYNFYVQQMLDTATQQAARQIQIGAAQAATGGAAADVQQTICSALANLLPCASIAISSQVVTDYYHLTTIGQVPQTNGTFNPAALPFCPGSPGQLVLLTTFFPAPLLAIPFLPVSTVTYQGGTVHVVVSTAAFMNEQYSATGATPAGC